MSEKKKNKGIKIFKTVLTYIIIAFLTIFIFFEIFLPKQTVKVFSFKPYNVITRSMEPVLNQYDLIVVNNFNVEDLEEDDIITFEADIDYNGEKEIVTHYIYSITEDGSGGYIIRTNRYFNDDTDVVPDAWVLSGDDVLGLYGFKIPFLGYVTEFFRSPFGIAALFVNAGIIVAIVYLIKREKKEKDHQQKNTE